MEIAFFICLFLIIYHLFLYPIILNLITIIYKNPTKSSNITPLASLIIAAYNEEKDIEQKIQNSLELDYPELEIIVVSDGSSDKTNEICRKYQDKITFFDRQERSGKINALNYTVPKAKGEILIFSDANTFYQPDAITQLIQHFNDPKVGCATGHVQLIAKDKQTHKQGEGIYTRLEKMIQIKESLIHSVVGLDGAMYALRKDLYQSLGNFYIEDFVMGMNIIKKGYRVIYEVEAKAWEQSSSGMNDEFKRRSRIVAGGFQSIYFMTFLIFKPFILFSYVSHKLLRWLLAELMLAVLILNILLLPNEFFLILLYCQVFFYLLATLGAFVKPLSFVYYFVMMQVASFWGLIKYGLGLQKITWKKAKRA